MMITLSKPCGHFGHLLQKFNLNSWLTVLTNCMKCQHVSMAWTMLSSFWWNLVIVRDNSAIARTTLRGLKYRWVVSNNNEISSNDDNVVQVRRRFVRKRGRVADGWSNDMLLLSFVIILQSCYKRSWHPRNPNTSHHMLWLSFVIILQSCYKRSRHPRNPISSHADLEIPDLKMFIRARNAAWMSKRTIGIRGPITCCYYLL